MIQDLDTVMVPVFAIAGMVGGAYVFAPLTRKGGPIGKFVRGYPNVGYSLTIAAGGIAGGIAHYLVFEGIDLFA